MGLDRCYLRRTLSGLNFVCAALSPFYSFDYITRMPKSLDLQVSESPEFTWLTGQFSARDIDGI